MTNLNKLALPEMREQLASSILEVLAVLPEAHRNVFIWKHYYGWSETQIASRLGCSTSEVENTLLEIGRTIFQRAQALLSDSATLQETQRPKEWCATCGVS
jgi:DNA-directed RNA polymerase specialized sigma subunit, sigma24 homolog